MSPSSFRLSLLAVSLLVCLRAPLLAAGVYVVGDELASAPEFTSRLKVSGLSVIPTPAEKLSELSPDKVHLLVVAVDKPLPPASRKGVTDLLNAGGRAIVIGPHAFDYTPIPANAVALADYAAGKSLHLVYPERKKLSTAPAMSDYPRQESLETPDGRPAIGFRTYLSGMGDFLVQFDASAVRAPARSVLQFWARGDSFMDLLALEITDLDGQTWLGFVSLGHDWEQHAVSLADFIPAGWSKADEAYPLLDPARIATVALGTNTLTIWKEKPMSFALGPIELAENRAPYYTPTSALLGLRLPFLENDTTIPAWLFDPFFGAHAESVAGLVSADARIEGPIEIWPCPVPYLEHPGTRMGTDHKKAYMLKFEREQRLVGLWKSASGTGRNVAELRIASSGPTKGSNLVLFGVSGNRLLGEPALLDSLARVMMYVAVTPKVAGATVNTTSIKKGEVSPTVRVVVQNPQPRIAHGKVVVTVAGGLLRGEIPLDVPSGGTASRTVQLSAVPEGFPFEHFEWKVTFESDLGGDSLADVVDVERGLIEALSHMVRIQRQYPDGRYSHHYFGDAYGVRAMFAYLDLLRREPQRLQRNRDLWSEITPAEIRASGLQFVDMLVARQNEDGSVPMGYGEHHHVYNVADGGQIALSVGEVALLVDDPVRREAYLTFCRRFVDWAETYFIDAELSAKLTGDFPEKAAKGETRAGHYGLGAGGRKRNETGPSWVLPDILGAQILLSYVDSNPDYLRLVERNTRFYVDSDYSTVGYFQAEAMFWAWLTVTDETLRQGIADNLRDSFLAGVLGGKENDVYDLGGRATLRALSLIYYRRYLEDSAEERAAQLKYTWAFASEKQSNGMRRAAEAHPKPAHGESIGAAKYAAFSAIWAIEMLDPGSSLLRVEGFPRAPVKQ